MSIKPKITNSAELQERVKELERKLKYQESDIKMNFAEVKNNLHPKKVVKNTFSYLAETPEIQKTFVNTVIGFLLGYASKKAVQFLAPDNIDRTVQNLVNHQVDKLESGEPQNVLSKAITLVRKYTPQDSPIYPFVRYK